LKIAQFGFSEQDLLAASIATFVFPTDLQLLGLIRPRCHRPGMSGFSLRDGLLQQIFDLAVDAAEFVHGPALQLSPELGIDSQQKRFP
jgi:hypothetical protein